MDSLVAINLIGPNNILLNSNNGVPFLYYWDGKFDVIESLKEDKYFLLLIKDKCINLDNYTKSKISFFYFMYDDNDKEVYKENIAYVQNIFNLESIGDTLLSYAYILKYFKELLNIIPNKPELSNENEIIKFIFTKWSKDDIENMLRNFLLDKEKLSVININHIINYYKENF